MADLWGMLEGEVAEKRHDLYITKAGWGGKYASTKLGDCKSKRVTGS